MKKILDSSIFIRFLTRDIEDQFIEAREIFTEIEEGLLVASVSITTIQELLWTLEYTYTIPREEFVPSIETLFSLKNMKIIEIKKSLLFEILEDYKDSVLDFSQCYLIKIKKEQKIASFDKQVIKADPH